MLSNEDSRVALLLLLLLLLFLHQFFILLSVLPLPLLEATKRSQSPRPDPISLLSNLLLLVVGVVLRNVAVVLVASQVRELDVRAACLLLSLAEEPLLSLRLLCARYHFFIVPLFFSFPIFAFLEFLWFSL